TAALQRLEPNSGDPIDVILADLRLPELSGVNIVRVVRDVSGRTPIVVLTGVEDDEATALACIDAGAQDYLHKSEMRPALLRRSIGYALSRVRESEVRELRNALEHYRQMSGPASATSVTAALAGTASVRERFPDVFETFVQRYSAVLRQYFDRLVLDAKRPRDEMERIVTELGDYGAGPRDLVDVHMVALNRSVESQTGLKAQTLSVEGRLLALEMMGLLVDYYRVGRRRMRGTETS
nr:response regulator [Acidobacteriota bacterium]